MTQEHWTEDPSAEPLAEGTEPEEELWDWSTQGPMTFASKRMVDQAGAKAMLRALKEFGYDSLTLEHVTRALQRIKADERKPRGDIIAMFVHSFLNDAGIVS